MKWDLELELKGYFGDNYYPLDREQINLIMSLGINTSFKRDMTSPNKIVFRNPDKGMEFSYSDEGELLFRTGDITLEYANDYFNGAPGGKLIKRDEGGIYIMQVDNVYYYDQEAYNFMKENNGGNQENYFAFIKVGIQPDRIISNDKFGLTTLLKIANNMEVKDYEPEEKKEGMSM